MEKIVLVTTTRTQKETSNTFDSHIMKLSQSYCLYLAIEEITQMRKVQKKRSHEIYSLGERENKEGVRETTKDPCLLLLKVGFSWLCWQNYLDSQSFYFQFLILIRPARFTKSFCSVRRFYLSAQKCLGFLRTLRFFSAEKCLFLTNCSYELPPRTLSPDCLHTELSTADWTLHTPYMEYRQFLAPPMNNDT